MPLLPVVGATNKKGIAKIPKSCNSLQTKIPCVVAFQLYFAVHQVGYSVEPFDFLNRSFHFEFSRANLRPFGLWWTEMQDVKRLGFPMGLLNSNTITNTMLFLSKKINLNFRAQVKT